MKINKYTHKYFLLLLFLTMLVGCESYSEESQSPKISQIVDSIKAEIPLNFVTEANNTKALKRFFSLNASDYEEVSLFSPSSSMDVEELLIVKVKSPEQVDIVETAIENRVDKQLQSFSGYAPEQCALLEDYVFKIKGNYIFYSVGEKAEEMKQIFVNSVK